MILSADERAALAARLEHDPAWLAKRARIESAVMQPRRRARLVAEALERHALACGLLDPGQVRRITDALRARPIVYPPSGVI